MVWVFLTQFLMSVISQDLHLFIYLSIERFVSPSDRFITFNVFFSVSTSFLFKRYTEYCEQSEICRENIWGPIYITIIILNVYLLLYTSPFSWRILIHLHVDMNQTTIIVILHSSSYLYIFILNRRHYTHKIKHYVCE